MLYLDCEKWCEEHHKSMDELIRAGISVGVIWQDGRPFHRPYAIRINLAVTHSLVVEAMDRLDKYVLTKAESLKGTGRAFLLPACTDNPFILQSKSHLRNALSRQSPFPF